MGKKAFLFGGFMVLVWIVFWHGALRTMAIRNPNSNIARGLLFNV